MAKYDSHNPDGGLRLGDTDPDMALKVILAAPRTLNLKDEKVPCPPGLTIVRRNPFEQRISLDSNPSVSIISSFLHPTIPSEPWIPLSFLGEEKLQVHFCEAGATDLDMKLCVFDWKFSVLNSPPNASRLWALHQMPRFGAYLDGKELESYLRGDISRTAPSGNFVIWAHLLRLAFSPDISPTPSVVRLFTRQFQLLMERAVDTLKSKNHWAAVRSLAMAIPFYVFHCMLQTGLLYVQKTCNLIKAANLRFVPECGPPPEFSEHVHKTLVPLSQTIYWANYLFLTRHGPEPNATADLEREFRQEVPVGDFTPTTSHIDLIPLQ